mmetsp:Transcript_858/g.1639  ORF Transcript_858/g.1639 Transcript_858/m.1639 type:complete len:203 (+) Transcript_858:54-662(+)
MFSLRYQLGRQANGVIRAGRAGPLRSLFSFGRKENEDLGEHLKIVPLADSPHEKLRSIGDKLTTVYGDRASTCEKCGFIIPSCPSDSSCTDRVNFNLDNQYLLSDGKKPILAAPQYMRQGERACIVDWESYLVSRSFPAASNPRTKRILSRVFTFPLSIAKALEDLYLKDEKKYDYIMRERTDPIVVSVVGARAEGLLPLIV